MQYVCIKFVFYYSETITINPFFFCEPFNVIKYANCIKRFSTQLIWKI